MNQKNESELGDLYIFYVQNNKLLQTTFENYM